MATCTVFQKHQRTMSISGTNCPPLRTHHLIQIANQYRPSSLSGSVLTMYATRVVLEGFLGKRPQAPHHERSVSTTGGPMPRGTTSYRSSAPIFGSCGSVQVVLYKMLPLPSMSKEPSNSPQTSMVMCMPRLALKVMSILTESLTVKNCGAWDCWHDPSH